MGSPWGKAIKEQLDPRYSLPCSLSPGERILSSPLSFGIKSLLRDVPRN